MITTRDGVSQILSVNALQVIWRIINAAHGCQAQMSVGVESNTGAEGFMYSVAQGVTHEKIDIQYAVASACGFKGLAIHPRCCQRVAVFYVSGTGADYGVNVRVCGITHKPMGVRHTEIAVRIVDKRHYAVVLVGIEIYCYRTLRGERM